MKKGENCRPNHITYVHFGRICVFFYTPKCIKTAVWSSLKNWERNCHY